MRNPIGLLLVLLSLGLPLTGCSLTTASPGAEQRLWILESFGDESVPVESFDAVMPHLTLAEGTVSGNLAVNSFNGTYELSGADISFSRLASTKKAGPPEAMEQEAQFIAALEAAAHIEVEGGKLTILDSDDTVVMRLTEALEG